jgi:hypothetical protein
MTATVGESRVRDLYLIDRNIRRLERLLSAVLDPDLRRVIGRRLDSERWKLARCDAGAVDPQRLFHAAALKPGD